MDILAWLFKENFKIGCLQIASFPTVLSLSKCQFLELTKPHLELVNEYHSLNTQESVSTGNDKDKSLLSKTSFLRIHK